MESFDAEKVSYPESFKTETPCNYFNDGRLETIEYFYPNSFLMDDYDQFLSRGYRRYGDFFYHTVCSNCRDCIPLRVSISEFTPSRSQKRTIRKNKDIIVYKSNFSELDEEKLALYRKYKDKKHPDAQEHNYFQEIANFHYGFNNVIELDYYINEKLVGVSLLDAGKESLSAVYFYYDPDYLNRRLGVYSALTEISFARSIGKKYYYLGYYIEALERMSYKKYFRPNYIYSDDQWKPYLKTDISA